MPETNSPKLSPWMAKLQSLIDSPNRDLYLIGHSIGVVTILRYLESLQTGETIGGAVFVAGFSSDDLGFEELKNFFTTPINLNEVKKHCPHFVAIHSDNDPYVSLRQGEIFKEKLGAKLIVKHQMGHFSGAADGGENSCIFLPEVSSSIVEMSLKK